MSGMARKQTQLAKVVNEWKADTPFSLQLWCRPSRVAVLVPGLRFLNPIFWEARTCCTPPWQSLSVSGLKVGRLHLATLVLLDIVGHALVFSQGAHSRTLDV